MNSADLLAEGRCVTLEEMLIARDQRAARQQHMLDGYRLPLISLTLVIPGAIKNTPALQRVLNRAVTEIKQLCATNVWEIAQEYVVSEHTGPEWMTAVCASAQDIKRVMTTLEMHHPLGRLWDIDVIDVDGRGISRRELDLPPRHCLICDEEAHVCARSQRHTTALLLDEIARKITNDERINSH